MSAKTKQPKLIIISAPSGAGKSTLCHKLLEDFSCNLVLSVSSTTRPPRKGDQHGREYFFISPKDFQAGIDAGQFAEWAKVHGNFYGTSREVIDRSFAKGCSVLLEIDVQGAAALRKSYPERYCSVFISPPSMEELECRLRGRGTDSEETIQKRLKNARDEMSRSSEFEHVVVNDDFNRCYNELKEIVRRHVEI